MGRMRKKIRGKKFFGLKIPSWPEMRTLVGTA